MEIGVETPVQRELARAALKKIHVPGEETSEDFRVFGYLQGGQSLDFIGDRTADWLAERNRCSPLIRPPSPQQAALRQ
jgi:hypothetical protein